MLGVQFEYEAPYVTFQASNYHITRALVTLGVQFEYKSPYVTFQASNYHIMRAHVTRVAR
jgi:hypothetical protein